MVLESTARLFSFSLSRIYIGLLLIEHSLWSKKRNDVIAAKRWFIDRQLWLVPPIEKLDERIKENEIVAMHFDENDKPSGVGDYDVFGKMRPKL